MNPKKAAALGLFLLVPLAAPLRAAAPNPSVLTVRYEKTMLPVVKVTGTDPVVIVEGKEKRIRSFPDFRLDWAPAFGPGFVQISSGSIDGIDLVDSIVAQTQKPKRLLDPKNKVSYFEATMKSKLRLQGGFVVVMAYPRNLNTAEALTNYETYCKVHELQELPADKEVKVVFSAVFPSLRAEMNYLVQVFDADGREVMTNMAPYTWSYLAKVEWAKFCHVADKYRQKFAGQDHDVVPVLKPAPLFPDDFTKPDKPGTATLRISPEGTVASIEIDGIEDERLRQSFADALGGWLFLPKLRGGVPVACKVEIPLQF